MSELRQLAARNLRAGRCTWRRGLHVCGLYRPQLAPVNIVVERADWVLKRFGEEIVEHVNSRHPGTAAVTTAPDLMVDTTVHFASQYMWLTWGQHMSRSNRFVVSFFHGKREDGDDIDRHIDLFLESVPRLSRIVTAASIIEERLISWGVDRQRIVRIPLGVDTQVFQFPDAAQRDAARRRFNVPDGALCIGSFQKDGVGWGEGDEPKLIKGPDLFVEAVARIARERPVHVLLTGPARGYVKQGLASHGISFHHEYLKDQRELTACYHALDLYLVTSREEGGPLALLESMATGVPVVSTPVGMSPDVIDDGRTGGLADVDADKIGKRALELLADDDALVVLKDNARERVLACDWREVACQHHDLVYRPLIGESS